jgi:hypothetical protein
MRWSSVAFVSDGFKIVKMSTKRTMKLCNIHAELVSLLQHSSTSVFDEGIEARCELVHATAQIFKTKVDAGQLVGHGWHVM